jgi:drug/metabolite transporter (DMT)-like permease
LPVVLLGVVATAIAYLLGISGVARLRPSFASLMGLAEVLFAVLIAWLLLDERMTALQVIGGIVVLLGLALARRGESSVPAQPQKERIPVSPLNLSESTL